MIYYLLFIFLVGNLLFPTSTIASVYKTAPGFQTIGYTIAPSPRDIARDSNGDYWITDLSGGGKLIGMHPNGSIFVTVSGLSMPMSVAIDANNNIYVADFDYGVIYKYDVQGNLITSWSSAGGSPNGLFIDSSNNLYVADWGYGGIKYDGVGNILQSYGTSADRPTDIAVAGDGTVYVACELRKVKKYQQNGSIISTKTFTLGSGDGQARTIVGFTLDADQNYFISDNGSGRHDIQKFDSNGNFISKFNEYSSYGDTYYWVAKVSVLSDNYLYVVDEQGQIGKHNINDGSAVALLGSSKTSADNRLWEPVDVATDNSGNIYVADKTWKILKYNSNGEYIKTYLNGAHISGVIRFDIDANDNLFVASNWTQEIGKYDNYGNLLFTFGSTGSGQSQFQAISDIFIAPNNYIYISDSTNNNVQKFDLSGNFVSSFNASGSLDGNLDTPIAIYVGTNGHLFVGENKVMTARVREFDENGIYVRTFCTGFGGGNGQCHFLGGIVQDLAGNLVVSDSVSAYVGSRLQRFLPNGNFKDKWGDNGTASSNFINAGQLKLSDTGAVLVVEPSLGRVQSVSMYNQIQTGVNIEAWSGSTNITYGSSDGALSASTDVTLKKTGGVIVAKITTALLDDLNWTTVTADTDETLGKSFVNNLASAPGTINGHTLYIPIPSGQSANSVLICPHASKLLDVDSSCSDGVSLTINETKMISGSNATATRVTIGGTSYWKVDGLTGTGGMSSVESGQAGTSQTQSQSTVQSSSMPKAPTCNDSQPSNAPDLFQIDVENSQATLYFVPVSNRVSNHYISFSEKQNEYMYGVETNHGQASGVQSFTIRMLSPDKIYYFKIRGQNGCMPGEWSNEMKAKTQPKGAVKKKSYYKNDLDFQISNTSYPVDPSIKTVLGTSTDKPKNKQLPHKELVKPTTQPTSTFVLPKEKSCFLWWCY